MSTQKKKGTAKKSSKKVTEPKKVTNTKNAKKGVGDLLEIVTERTGIKRAVELFSELTGVDCGCEERKQKLNNLFARHSHKPKCLTKDTYDRIKRFTKGVRTKVTREQAIGIATVYSEIFGTRYEVWCGHCPSVWRAKIGELEKLVKVYDKELES